MDAPFQTDLMPSEPTPLQIIETLFPYLKTAAVYARQIQADIAAHPDKEADSMFGAALSDADLSVQTLVEVALLAHFPHIRFYGEEHEKSYNTKYFRSIELGGQDDYLVTLDPIDGTQFYLDGHSNYQIILGVLNADEFEAVIAITPAQNQFYYAFRGQGCWQGMLEDGLAAVQPLRIESAKPAILLGLKMTALTAAIPAEYQAIATEICYSKEQPIPNVNGMLNGELSGAVIRVGKFIDGAALAFLAQEAGCIVTTHRGEPLPPLSACSNYERPGLVIAVNATVHQHLLGAIKTVFG